MEKTKKIDGINFSVSSMMALEAFKLKSKLIKIFAPSLGKLFGSFDFNKDFKDIDLSKVPLAEIIQNIMSELDDETLDNLLRKLLWNVTATFELNGKKTAIAFCSDFETTFNLVFNQKLFTLYPLLAFVLEVNYPDFFQKIKSIGPKMKKMGILKKDEMPLFEDEND